jgi:hypothetical protein
MTRFLFRHLSIALSGAVLLAGCAGGIISQSQSADITKVLTQVGNTLTADLQQQRLVALAATPPDLDGAACAGTLPDPAIVGDLGTSALGVAAAIQKVSAVTANKQVGALTIAEIATLYQPGSAQFNWAVKMLETGCIAKVHDVNQAINSTAGIITALPSVLALAGAPVGL